MFKRLSFVSALAAMLLLASVTQAFAWANGGPSPNNYGTHDWILDSARRVAGTEGRWVNRSVALLASDDPDTYRVSETYHLFHERGLRRGAAQRVADYYYLAVESYRSGDTTTASKYVGILSHYYSDVLVPFHSSYNARTKTSLHLEYEHDVDDLTRRSSALPGWVVARTPIPVTDVRKRVVGAAAYSRYRYASLYKYYGASHRITGTTSTITRLMLNRAANDLADIIRTIPTAAGVASAPASMTATVSYRYPAQRGLTGAFFTCVDANGSPIEGAAVVISWPLSNGSTTKVIAFTDKFGVAHDYENVGTAPLLKTMTVTGTQRSSGKTVSADTWYMTTPALADGRAGISTLISDRYPGPDTTITASATCRDTLGRLVARMPIRFRWYAVKDGVPGPELHMADVLTNASGIAVCPWNTGSDHAGEVIYARAETVAAGHTRAAVANLVVQQEN